MSRVNRERPQASGHKSAEKRLLHVKLRVLVLEEMTEAEAIARLRRAAQTGIIPKGIDLAWIDWARPRDMHEPPHVYRDDPLRPDVEVGKRYLGREAHAALVSFLGALHSPLSSVEIEAAAGEYTAPVVAPPKKRRPQKRRPRADIRTARRPKKWGFGDYHAFIRQARRVWGLSYKEAQALYREVRDYTGRKVFRADVLAYADLLEDEPDEIEDSLLYEPEVEVSPRGRRLGALAELELTARTYKKDAPQWRLEVVKY